MLGQTNFICINEHDICPLNGVNIAKINPDPEKWKSKAMTDGRKFLYTS